MSGNIQDIMVLNRDTKDIERSLPEKLNIDAMQDLNDVIIYKGMKSMNKILDDKEETSMQKTKAFNALVGLGRLLDARKEHELQKEKDNIGIVFNDETLIVNAEETD